MIDSILKEVNPKMGAAIENFKADLARIRTGRANPGILDGILVSYYGTMTPLREMASVSVPEINQIAIKPWDRNALSDIETAVRNSDIGLSPINDGVQVRLILPPLTEERRKEIVNSIKKMGEDTKIVLRNIRREAWDRVQTAEKNNEATEDDRRQAEEELNRFVTERNMEVDTLVAQKETEIMKI